MTCGRILRLLLFCLTWLPCSAFAVSSIDIRIGEIRHPAAQVEKVSATIDMEGHWQGNATLKRGDLSQLSKELPALPVTVSKGIVQGRAEFSGRNLALDAIRADLILRDAAFSNADGMRAGENVGATVALDARRGGNRWNLVGSLDWTDGEVFWQPVYFARGGIAMHGSGWFDEDVAALDQGHVTMAGIGAASLSGRLRRTDNAIDALDVVARDVDAAGFYGVLLKPFLEKTVLANLETAGRMDATVSWRESALAAFNVALRGFDVEDRDGRFALYKVNARIPWALNAPTQASVQYEGGRVLKMRLGEASLEGTLNGYSLTSPALRLPVLDGVLTLKDVSAAFVQKQWHWHLSSSLTPVSMTEFTHAVGWPSMEGRISAMIPKVTYTAGRMAVDGAMLFNIFDGTVALTDLILRDPLGAAPRLNADIRMRDLDLGQLTRTFSFGAITGRLDGDVRELELSKWKPVRFDADFHSSPGSYPNKISQRAVENITALGGAGATAAIQRSFLRFFKEFNYASMGLSCKLRQGVCEMNGIEPTQSGFVIVKGSGIPAITVLGYNRNVSWGELLERVQRITQGNKPVIK
jgi:hypothetical protein